MKTSILNISIIAFAISLAGCGEKPKPVPEQLLNCDSAPATDFVLTAFTEKLVTEGAKGFADVDVHKAMALSSVSAKEKNEANGQYKCQADITINYPPDLSERIGEAFSDDSRRQALRDKLEERLGVVNGSGVYNQLNSLISDGPYGVVPMIPAPDEYVKYKEIIYKNSKSLFGKQLIVPVQYEIFPKKDADGKPMTDFKWHIVRRDPLDANLVILNLQGVL